MSLFLSSLPLWLTALVVVVIPSLAAVFGPVLVRRAVALENLKLNNEVAGFKFAVLGVMYAVMLGFAVIVVWEKYRDAEAATVQEAAAVVSISRLLEGLETAPASVVKQRLSDYARAVIAEDWPAMARAKMSPQVDQALHALYRSVLTVDANMPAPTANLGSPRQATIMGAILTELDNVTQGRRTRLMLASGVVPSVLWFALVAGAIVTLTFTFFFGSHSIRAQSAMSGMLAAVTFMGLFIVVAIDHPFTGSISVRPDAMEAALETLNQMNEQIPSSSKEGSIR